MSGRSVRLGFLVPSVNAILEPEVGRLLPEGTTAHFSRVKLPRNNEHEIARMVDYIPGAARLLIDAGVDAIGFACTAGSLIGGLGYDREIARLITSETGVDATTTASSVVDALRVLGVRRLALLAPYEQWLVDCEVDFLKVNGFGVVGDHGLGLPRPRDCEAVSPEKIRRYAREVDNEEADAVFISCADFQALAVAEAIEDDLGKPVVTSNQAIIWKLLRMAGLDEPLEGYGRLLRQ